VHSAAARKANKHRSAGAELLANNRDVAVHEVLAVDVGKGGSKIAQQGEGHADRQRTLVVVDEVPQAVTLAVLRDLSRAQAASSSGDANTRRAAARQPLRTTRTCFSPSIRPRHCATAGCLRRASVAMRCSSNCAQEHDQKPADASAFPHIGLRARCGPVELLDEHGEAKVHACLRGFAP
jgi:hypothetical protein